MLLDDLLSHRLVVLTGKGGVGKSVVGASLALAARARDGKSLPQDLADGTFTITSTGRHGGLLATPVINHPEVAILGVHAIKEKPVVRDGEIVPGHVMNLSLSLATAQRYSTLAEKRPCSKYP